MNKRLNMIATLVELLNLHMDGYSYPRQARRPKFSIHGKDQNIKIKIQIHENQVGELVLYDPRTDSDYDNPSMHVRGHHGPDIRNNNWPEELKKVPFSRHEEGRDYWAALDIVHLMAMHGFRVQAYGVSRSHLYIGGQLLPNSTEPYGRFSFWMDVTTAASYWRDMDPLAEESVSIPELPELTEEQRSMARTPRGPLVGRQIDHMAMYKEQAKAGYYDGVLTKPSWVAEKEAAELDALQELQAGDQPVDWDKLDLPDPQDVANVIMNPGAALGYMLVLDDQGNPIKTPREYELLRSFGTSDRPIDYYQQRLVAGDPLVQRQLDKLHAQCMADPVAMANVVEPKYRVFPGANASPEEVLRSMETLTDVATTAKTIDATPPVRVIGTTDHSDFDFVITRPGGGNYTIVRGKERPDIIAVGTDPGVGCPYVDPLSFGTMLPDPEQLSHIRVSNEGGDVKDAQVVPRRRFPRDIELGVISEVSIDHGTDYPHLRGMSRAQLDAYFADKEAGEDVYPEMLGMSDDELDVSDLVSDLGSANAADIKKRLLDHNAIEGEFVVDDEHHGHDPENWEVLGEDKG